jgi:hypothetical protein
MRRLVVLGALACIAVPATGDAATFRSARISVRVPTGWHVVHRRFANCINPAQRLALNGDGALVVVLETLDPRHYVRRFPARPRHFRVRGNPTPMECCAVHGRAGWALDFRAAGRGFYAFVYPGRPGSVTTALKALDSLRIRPR